MKRLLFFLLIVSSTSFAQDERLSVSAHLGYSLSNHLYVSDETDFRSTFNAGFEMRKQIAESSFYLQTGLRWNEYGFRDMLVSCVSEEGYYFCDDIDYRVTYFFLSIPAIAIYKFKKIVPGLTLSAGPQLSVYVTDKTYSNGEINFGGFGYPRLSLSSHFSLGYEKNIGDKWLIGVETFSNINYPIGWFFGLEGEYNFGLALSGRYILK